MYTGSDDSILYFEKRKKTARNDFSVYYADEYKHEELNKTSIS